MDLDILYPTQNIENADAKTKDMDRVHKNLVQKVFDLTLDMSLNELSVHYLKHSKVDTEDPFKTLVGLYEHELNEFYRSALEHLPYTVWNDVVNSQ